MEEDEKKSEGTLLTGTTLKVYRWLYRVGHPVGIREVQRGVKLSSSSVAEYHIRKLLLMGLIREQDKQYSVDRLIFENMIRIRKSIVPLQSGYAAFFGTMFVILAVFFRAQITNPVYLISLVATSVACGIFAYEANSNFRTRSV